MTKIKFTHIEAEKYVKSVYKTLYSRYKISTKKEFTAEQIQEILKSRSKGLASIQKASLIVATPAGIVPKSKIAEAMQGKHAVLYPGFELSKNFRKVAGGKYKLKTIDECQKEVYAVVTANLEKCKMTKGKPAKKGKASPVMDLAEFRRSIWTKFGDKSGYIAKQVNLNDDGTLREIVVQKSYFLGKYLGDSGEYDFLYLEYDGNIMAYDSYEEDASFQKVRDENFKSVKGFKLPGVSIEEHFLADTGGDKQSADVRHMMRLKFKGVKPTEANLVKINEMLDKLDAYLVK